MIHKSSRGMRLTDCRLGAGAGLRVGRTKRLLTAIERVPLLRARDQDRDRRRVDECGNFGFHSSVSAELRGGGGVYCRRR